MKKSLLIFMLAMFGINLMTIAQTITVSGVVSDNDTRETLPGVNIIEKGTSNGVITDVDGNYSITVSQNGTLVYSYTGYVTQEVQVGSQAIVNVLMSVDVQQLGEVIITGYSAQTKKSITGGVSVVDVENLENLPDQSVLGMVQGRTTGVQIGKNGGPGGSNLVRIRGYSNTSTNDPLYIIDGVQTNNGDVFNLINPSDVESIQILKDASSAAIYGARANNGVIIVTTKKGKSVNGSRINVSISQGLQTPMKEKYPSFLSPQQYADYIWTRQRNGGNFPSNLQLGSGDNPILPTYLTGGGGVSTVDISDYALIAGPDNNPIRLANQEGTNWVDEIFEPNSLTNINVSASNNTKNGSSFVSAGYYSNNGILLHTSFDRYSLRVNSEFKAKEFLTIGEDLTFAYSERKGSAGFQDEGGPVMMAHRIMPIVPVYDIMDNFAGTAGGGLGNASNPVASLTRGKDNITRTIRGLGNFYVNVNFLKNFDFKSTLGADFNMANGTVYTPLRLEDQEQQTTNRLTERNDEIREYNFSNTLKFSKQINIHSINVLVGTEFVSRVYRGLSTYRNDFASSNINFLYLNAGGAGVQINEGYGNASSLFSYFGKADYSFKNKYFITAIFRVDQSSRFAENNRTASFPSIGLGWSLIEESFLENSNVFDDLKLRAAWGRTGNQETIDPYPTFSTFGLNSTTNNYDIGGSSSTAVVGYASAKDGNADLKWETAETIDIGLEMALLDYKLGIELGYYTKKTSDMLVQVTRPGTSGLASDPYVNIGEMSNKGFEFLANYTDNITPDLSFDIGLNFSRNVNQVLKLDNNDKTFIGGFQFRQNRLTRTTKGQPISSFFGYQIDGFYTTQEEVETFEQSNGAIGSFKYKDVNGDGKINADDRTFIGSPHPDFIFGVNLGLTYKDVSLSIFMDGIYGNEIYNFKKYFTDFHFFPGAVTTNVLDAWTPDNPDAILPISSDGVTNQEIPNSYYVEDGSYLRMRNIKLAWQLPSNILETLRVSKAKVYLQVDNAYVFTKYSGLDPEVNVLTYDAANTNFNLGIDRGIYPNPRTFLIGIDFSF